MLKADHSLADLWSNNILGSDPSKAVLALDFDQTLTLVRPTGAAGAREKTLRGGTAARQALDEMAKAGVRMCIVTAQSPSAATVQNAANECRELGIDKLFGVEPVQLSLLEKALSSGSIGGPPPGGAAGAGGAAASSSADSPSKREAEALNQRMSTMEEKLDKLLDISDGGAVSSSVVDVTDGASSGSSAAPTPDEALTRLVLLLLLKTDRVAADLVRIGASTKLKEDGTGLTYRMWNVSQGVWGGEQKLVKEEATNAALCPVRAWEAYAAATSHLRTSTSSTDRLLLSPTDAAKAMTAEEVLYLARKAASSAGLSERDIKWFVQSPAEELTLADSGVKIAMMGHVVAARYNKPEGLMSWLEREGLTPERLAFVDDNSDNAFSMFMAFAALEKAHRAEVGKKAIAPPICCSVWYPPETSATQENFDAATREMLEALSKGPL